MKGKRNNLEDLLKQNLKIFEDLEKKNKLIGEQKDLYSLMQDLVEIKLDNITGFCEGLSENYNLRLDFLKNVDENLSKLNEVSDKYKILEINIKSIEDYIKIGKKCEDYFSNNIKDMLKNSYVKFDTEYKRYNESQKSKDTEYVNSRKTAFELGNVFLYLSKISKKYDKRIFLQDQKITNVKLKITQLSKIIDDDYIKQEKTIQEQKSNITLLENNYEKIKQNLNLKDEELGEIKKEIEGEKRLRFDTETEFKKQYEELKDLSQITQAEYDRKIEEIKQNSEKRIETFLQEIKDIEKQRDKYKIKLESYRNENNESKLKHDESLLYMQYQIEDYKKQLEQKLEKTVIEIQTPRNYNDNRFDLNQYLKLTPIPKEYSLNTLTDILQGMKNVDLMVDRISKVSDELTKYDAKTLNENAEFVGYVIEGIKKEISQGSLRDMIYENIELKKDIENSLNKIDTYVHA